MKKLKYYGCDRVYCPDPQKLKDRKGRVEAHSECDYCPHGGGGNVPSRFYDKNGNSEGVECYYPAKSPLA